MNADSLCSAEMQARRIASFRKLPFAREISTGILPSSNFFSEVIDTRSFVGCVAMNAVTSSDEDETSFCSNKGGCPNMI